MFSFLSSVFGDESASALAKASEVVPAALSHENRLQALTSEELTSVTSTLKERLKTGETLDQLMPEAFALVRESARRLLGQRHYDVQLVGGAALHQGNIAEMRTGEGKTLVATLPVYLNALSGKGVHVVTVNDYLSQRDAVWMGQIYNHLGLSVGVITHEKSYLYDPTHIPPKEEQQDDTIRDTEGSFRVVHEYLRPCTRREAYEADITYGTNQEFGFDYLRDNIEQDKGRVRQRGHHFAVVDEIDSILIDEARTPLIISAPMAEAGDLYIHLAHIASQLRIEEDYTVDEKHKTIAILENGISKAEKVLGVGNIYTDAGVKYVHHLETAVRAKALFHKDKDYVVRNGEVVIVDEFTGRLQPGRRWSDGLHQAIEAKEGVAIQHESRTFASITYQNYFRLYEKLSGMTGTARTSSEEFFKVYGLTTVSVPTNRPSARKDHDDLFFQTERGKFKAIARAVKQLHEKGQPVLVGTVSVEKNELLSAHFKQEGIPHEILNAKNHEREGEIVAQAGRRGAVTIATNMAGRGVDIKLGGSPETQDLYEEVRSLGGLFVIGTERHEARRIDNQLRGRAGRQGDLGETQFFVSLEDSLMRVFASDVVKRMMGTFGIPEDEPIQSSMITRALEKAQTRIEEINFDMRKHVLAYDDVLNAQRTGVYRKRRAILLGDETAIDVELVLLEERDGSISDVISKLKNTLGTEESYKRIRQILLRTIDILWVDHLEMMDHLRSSVDLRGVGQRDPLVEYKKEGLHLFKLMEEAYLGNVERALRAEVNGPTGESGERVRIGTVKQTVPGGAKEPERNERVRITNGTEEREMKYKKAKDLLSSGWKIVE